MFGAYPLRPPSFIPGVLIVGAIIISWDRVFAAGAGVAMLAALLFFLNRTAWGEALRAVSQSREAASIVGINSTRFYMLAFGVGGALAGGAGALVGPLYSLSPSMGLLPDTQAFAIVVLGGMGSLAGSIIAGLLIGVSESMFVAFFPDPSRALTYAQAFSLLILMLVLLLRPTGLFGRAHTVAGMTRPIAICHRRRRSPPPSPDAVNGYWLSVGVMAVFYAIVAASWALLVGYAGQFSFGHMAFVSIGAYTTGLLATYFDVPIPLGMVARRRALRRRRQRHRLHLPAPARPLSRAVHRRVLRGPAHRAGLGGRGDRRLRPASRSPPLFHTRSNMPAYYLGLALLLARWLVMGARRHLPLGPVLPRHPRERGRRRRGRREGDALPRAGIRHRQQLRRPRRWLLRALHRHPDARHRIGRPDGPGGRHGGDRRRRKPASPR